MAVYRGCFGKVLVGGTPSVVAEVRNYTLNENAEVLDASSIGDCTKSKNVGAVEWDGTVNCWWDDTDTNGQVAMTVGTSIAIEVGPEGNTTGDFKYSGTGIIQSVEVLGGVDGLVERNISFVGTGSLTKGTFV